MQTGCYKLEFTLIRNVLICFVSLVIAGCGQSASEGLSAGGIAGTQDAGNSSKTISATITSNSTTIQYNGDVSLDWSATNADSCIASGDWAGEKGIIGSEIIRSVTNNSSFALTCSNATESTTSTLVVTVSPPSLPVISLSANPVNVVIGDSTTLSWNSFDATSCSASGNWSGNMATTGSSTRNNLTSNQSYTLSCSGPGGDASATIDVTVVAPSAPIVNLTANPSSVSYNGSTNLSWTTDNVDTCEASGDWSGSKNTAGSNNRYLLTSNQTYTITCSGSNGSASDSVTVSVGPAPVPSVDLTASPTSVPNNGSTILRWTGSNVESCTASGDWSGSKNTSGSSSQDNLTSDRTYSLACTGAYGNTSGSVSVTVTPGGPLPDNLLQISDLQYRGAFRLSNDDFGVDDVNAAAGPIAYNPTNHSIFIVGHDDVTIAEFAIPTLGTNQSAVTNLPIVNAPLQNFKNVVSGISNPQGIDIITGMLYVNGKLIVNAEEKYNGGGDNTDTTIVVDDAENLSSSARKGFYRLTGAAKSAGYLAPIPPEWQASFGQNYMTGWSNVYSINSRYSIGPSLFAFDAEGLLAGNNGNSGPVNATAFMNFPYSSDNWITPDALNRGGAGSISALWNHMTAAVYGFIVPGTNTFAVFGATGGINSGIGYKITQDTGNVCAGYCPYVASDYTNYYWLFDVQDILDATNVYDPQPYAYGPISVPFDNGGTRAIIGGTFDSGTGMLYFTLERAGGTSQYDSSPLIVGYQVPIL